MNYPTPHINARPEDFAKTVLMPGDPKRSEFIAKSFLKDAVLVNDLRGVQGYTGYYKDKKVSVMASGMGMPSISIYSYELYNFFNVENIIRVGSAGAMQEKVNVRDIVIAMGASTDSAYQNNFDLPGSFSSLCDFELLEKAVDVARREDLNFHVGNILSTDVFYNDREVTSKWTKMGVLAVEMEAAALYMNASRAGKRALAICTVSDHLLRNESLSGEERQNSFAEMIRLALDTAVEMG